MRLFLSRDDGKDPDSEVIRNISAWIKFIACLLQKDGKCRTRPNENFKDSKIGEESVDATEELLIRL